MLAHLLAELKGVQIGLATFLEDVRSLLRTKGVGTQCRDDVALAQFVGGIWLRISSHQRSAEAKFCWAIASSQQALATTRPS